MKNKETSENISLLIIKSIFKDNQAFEQGGCIKWIGKEPLLLNSLFINNYAKYGNNIAASPIKMNLLISNKSYFLIF